MPDARETSFPESRFAARYEEYFGSTFYLFIYAIVRREIIIKQLKQLLIICRAINCLEVNSSALTMQSRIPLNDDNRL